MSLIGDLIEDDTVERLADLVVHMANLRQQNKALRLQRDRYRGEAERFRLAARQQTREGTT